MKKKLLALTLSAAMLTASGAFAEPYGEYGQDPGYTEAEHDLGEWEYWSQLREAAGDEPVSYEDWKTARILREAAGEYYGEYGIEYYEYPGNPEYDDTPRVAAVFYNGQPQEAPEDLFRCSYIRYTYVAELAGYTTKYDPDTHTVISEKDGRKIEIPLDDNKLTQITGKDGEVTEYSAFIQVFDDRLYLISFDLNQLLSPIHVNPEFEYRLNDNGEYESYITLHMLDISLLKDRAEKQLGNLIHMLELASHNGFTAQRSLGTADVTFKAPNFGTTVEGSCNFTAEANTSDGTVNIKFDADTDGIFNVIKVMSKFLPYNSEISLEDFDFTQPIDFEMFMTDSAIYTKSDFLHNLLIDELFSYGNSEEFIEKTTEETRGKFLRRGITAIENGEPDYFDITSDPADFISEAFALSAAAAGDYEVVLRCLDAYCSLFDESHLKITEGTGGEADITYSLNADDLRSIMNSVLPDDDPEDGDYTPKADVMEIFDSFDIDISQTTKITAEGMKSNSEIIFSMENIPNEWDLDIGSLTVKITENSAASRGEAEVTLPGEKETVDFDKLRTAAEEDSEKNNPWHNEYFPEYEYAPESTPDSTYTII